MKTVPKEDPRRAVYVKKYGIKVNVSTRRWLTSTFLDQLDHCKDDYSRRVLLGLGRPFDAAERKAGVMGAGNFLERKSGTLLTPFRS